MTLSVRGDSWWPSIQKVIYKSRSLYSFTRRSAIELHGQWNYHLKSCSPSQKVKEGYVGQRQKHLRNKAMRELCSCWKSYSYSSTVGGWRTRLDVAGDEVEGDKEEPDPEWYIQCSKSWSSQLPFSQKEIPLFISIYCKSNTCSWQETTTRSKKNTKIANHVFQPCLPTQEDQSYALISVLQWWMIK